MGYIYMLTDTRNDKKYIGKHIDNNKNYWSGGLIPNRIAKKYGKDIFNRVILENDIPDDILSDKEIFYIKQYNSIKEGYNLTLGGDGGDTISNNPNKDIIINKIKETLKGRIFTDEHKNKLRENHMSKDSLNRKKLSEALKGKEKSGEHKKNLSKASSIYNKSIGRWVGDNNPSKNKEIKAYISKLNKERAYQKRQDNIKNFIYDLNNNLINSSNIKQYKYKLWCWRRDLGEEILNSIIPKHITDGFIELCDKVKNENIKIRANNFIGFTHSDTSKIKISKHNKDKFLKYCDNIHNVMIEKEIHYLIDAFPKNEYEKIRKKIKSSKFLIYLNSEIKERILAKKTLIKKKKSVTNINNFYGNKNKSIIIDDFKYNSISEASKLLEIDRGIIRYRLKHKQFTNYNYL